MQYRITFYDTYSNQIEEHFANWQSEVNVIVGTGLEEGYDVMVERLE